MKLDISTVLFIIDQALTLLKAYLGKDGKFDTPAALVKISAAANKAYQAEVGQPIDEALVPPLNELP